MAEGNRCSCGFFAKVATIASAHASRVRKTITGDLEVDADAVLLALFSSLPRTPGRRTWVLKNEDGDLVLRLDEFEAIFEEEMEKGFGLDPEPAPHPRDKPIVLVRRGESPSCRCSQCRDWSAADSTARVCLLQWSIERDTS
jgi:hypothetical protein